jgi:hypothetical protein
MTSLLRLEPESTNKLITAEERSYEEEERFLELNRELRGFGFNLESREPEYELFLRAWHEPKLRARATLTPEQLRLRREAAKQIIQRLRSESSA